MISIRPLLVFLAIHHGIERVRQKRTRGWRVRHPLPGHNLESFGSDSLCPSWSEIRTQQCCKAKLPSSYFRRSPGPKKRSLTMGKLTSHLPLSRPNPCRKLWEARPCAMCLRLLSSTNATNRRCAETSNVGFPLRSIASVIQCWHSSPHRANRADSH